MSSTTILQGTDGIRGRVSRDDPRDHNQNPLSFFLDSGLLTPAFFELYTHAYCRILLEKGCAEKGDSIVIGWDPRDATGEFNQAAISGICKAGLNTIITGVLPTPAIPLYMLKQKASGGIVLTASHNPSDQNGIKLFHGWTGLKFLPLDDAILSGKIAELQDLDLSSMSADGAQEDHSVDAASFFIEYQTDSRNSWIGEERFDNQVLVIDASKGAVAPVVKDIFSQYAFNDLILTNLEGGINESCGVADLEGHESIAAEQIINENSRFYTYETLRMMMKTAYDRKEIQSGSLKLSGLVFDGDGDRCFRLDYHPAGNEILISSGDQLGIHLARYIREKEADGQEKAWFINTVESDLKTAITAEEEGYQSVITGVGDKWILKQAVLDMIRAQVNMEHPGADEVRKILVADGEGNELCGLDLSKAWKKCIHAGARFDDRSRCKYRVGIEESGHCIIPGYLDVDGEDLICFAGNGIKSGLNTMLAVQWAVSGKPDEERMAYLKHPFQEGVKKTHYTYYVNKNKLMPGDAFRLELEQTIPAVMGDCFSDALQFDQVHFSEEAGLVYFKISREGKTVGSVFVRNSGTEDKSALYLRGEPEIGAELKEIGMKLHLVLLKELKKADSEFARLEKQIIYTISSGKTPDPLRENNPVLPFDRMMKEIEFKEGLIERTGSDLKLTEKGKILNDYWEAYD